MIYLKKTPSKVFAARKTTSKCCSVECGKKHYRDRKRNEKINNSNKQTAAKVAEHVFHKQTPALEDE